VRGRYLPYLADRRGRRGAQPVLPNTAGETRRILLPLPRQAETRSADPGNDRSPAPRPLEVPGHRPRQPCSRVPPATPPRSEEHTSELQSRENLVCRLL